MMGQRPVKKGDFSRVAALLLATWAFAPAHAFAACTSPAGNAGDIAYGSNNVMVYCNGSNWISMGSGGSISYGTLTAGDFCTATGSSQISCTSSTINLTTQVSNILPSANGGTGVNNGASTITLGGNLTTSGAFPLTLTTTAATNVTLPSSGTLITNAVTTLSALSSIGTITTGVWNGSVIGAQYGGTGDSSLTAHGLLIGEGTSAVNVTAAGTAGQLLIGQGATSDPSFQTVSGDVTIGSTGITAIGTNKVTTADIAQIAAFSVLGNATSSSGNVTVISGTANQVLTVNSAGTALGFGAVNLGSSAAVSGLLTGTNGGTGVNNGANTITLGGNLSTAGAFSTSGANSLILTTTGATNVTLPTTGTLVAGTGTANYVARWTGASALGTGALYDNGTQVGINTSSPSTGVALDLGSNITAANSSLLLPGGTSGARPATGINGMIRYNPGTGIEAFISGSWTSLISGGTSGVTPVANGGTGDISLTQYGVLIGEGTGTVDVTSAGTTGTVLIGNTGSDPTFSNSPSLTNLTLSGIESLTFGTDYSTTGTLSDVAINTVSAVRFTGTTATTFYGIAAGSAGQLLELHNASNVTLTLSNQSANDSTAASRIITGTGADMIMASNSSVSLQYDGSAARWRVIGGSGGGIPAGTTGQVQFNSGSSTFNADSHMTWDNTNHLLTVGTAAATPVATTGTLAGITFNVIPQSFSYGSLGGSANGITLGSASAAGQMAYYSGTTAISGTPNLYVVGSDIAIGTNAASQLLTVNGNVDAMGTNGYLTEIANATTGGTTQNKLAKLTAGTAVTPLATDTDGIVGIVVNGAGTSGNAQIAVSGQASCIFENATTAGDFVTIGSTTAGDCHDAGATRSTTSQTIGRVLTSGSAGTYTVALGLAPSGTADGSAIGTGTANYVARWIGTTSIGTGVLYDNGTQVGIGTASPGGKLDIAAGGTNDILLGADSSSTTYNAVSLNGTLTDASMMGFVGAGGTDKNLYFKVPSTGNYIFNSGGYIGIGTTGPTSLLQAYDSAAKTASYTSALVDAFDTSTTASVNKVGMDIESTGTWTGTSSINTGLAVNATGGTTNYAATFMGGGVGIGTTTPFEFLQINTSTAADTAGTNGLMVTSASTTSGPFVALQSTGTGGHWWTLVSGQANNGGGAGAFQVYDNTTSTTRLIIGTTGLVGIGTTSPSYILDINGGSTAPTAARVTSSATTYGPELRLVSTGTSGQEWRFISNQVSNSGGTGNFSIYNAANSADRLVVTPTGNVGIGTTSPTSLIHAYSSGDMSIQAQSGGSSARVILNRGSTAAGDLLMMETSNTVNAEIGLIGSVNTMGFQTGTTADLSASTAQMVLTTAGYVGIGTATPSYPLHISSAAPTTLFLQSSNFLGANGNVAQILFQHGTNTTYRPSIEAYRDGADSNVGLLFSVSNPTSGGAAQTLNSMYINPYGSVGIGTTSPNYTLQVNGSFSSNTYSGPQQLPETGGSSQWIKVGTLTIGQFGHSAEVTVVSNGGYNASYSQSCEAHIRFKTSNGAGGDANGFYADSSYYLTNPSNCVQTVKWVGNAAGGSATAYTLYALFPAFTGGSYYSVETAYGSWAHSGTISSDPGSASSTIGFSTQIFDVNNGEIIADSNGVGFNVSPGSYPFQVGSTSSNGNGAYLSAAGVWTNASDRRVKENIVPSPYGLDALMRLKPVAYDMIGTHEKQIGFIAQDVLQVVPEVVGVPKNPEKEHYGLSYGNMVAVTVKSIQELKVENDRLKAANDEDRQAISALRKEFEDYKKAHP